MDLTLKIFDIALKVIVVMMCYRYLYLIVGFFGKAKVFPEAKKEHTYAVVICARNEEKVIGNLLDSIAAAVSERQAPRFRNSRQLYRRHRRHRARKGRNGVRAARPRARSQRLGARIRF